MRRLTCKPRLFRARARQMASGSAILLALASIPALADERHDSDRSAITAESITPPHPQATAPITTQRADVARGPLGWTAAGLLLALALCAEGGNTSRRGA